MSLVTIIIPTYNNLSLLTACVNSIVLHRSTPGLAKIVIVNNGDKGSIPMQEHPEAIVVDAGSNLGWEGGLKFGLQYADTPFVVFMNDDTFVPYSSSGWLLQMLEHFKDETVAAVGPSSNCVMGPQNAFIHCQGYSFFPVSFLIGFCMMLRRSALDEVGSVDDALPYHGDDIDLSIRLRKAGYQLICDKNVFVYHHGFQTGKREFGEAWNSVEMTEKTNIHLIKKHGLKAFWETITKPVLVPVGFNGTPPEDLEGNVVRTFVNGGSVLELGCGAKKTVPQAIGVDRVPRGQWIPGISATKSIADIVADVTQPLPFEDGSYDTIIARHILEHVVDIVPVLKEWGRIVKHGGKLIVAVPNEDLRPTIPMNYEHVHAFNPKSLKNIMEQLGWKTVKIEDPKNDISLVGVFEKNGLQ